MGRCLIQDDSIGRPPRRDRPRRIQPSSADGQPKAYELAQGLVPKGLGAKPGYTPASRVKSLLILRAAMDATREGKAVGIAPSADVLETFSSPT